MSERLTRKEIKHDIREDQFRLYVARAVNWIAENTRVLVAVVVGIIVAIALIVGYGAYREHRAEMASERLAEAIEVFEGETGAATATGVPPAPAATTDPEARRRAAELFREVRDMAGDEGPGAVATVYLGRIALAEGDSEEARRIFSEFVDEHQDHMLTAAAELALVELERAAGNPETAAERLRGALEDGSDSALPADMALYQLARTLEEMGRTEEARSTYRRLSDEYPASPYAAEASTKLQRLAG